MKNLTLFTIFVLTVISHHPIKAQHAEIVTNKLYGGSDYDEFRFIRPFNINQIITGGYSNSSNGNLTSNNGLTDQWLLSVDVTYNPEWSVNSGGIGYDEINGIEVTDGGDIVAACGTDGFGGILGCNTAGRNAHLFEVDPSGTLLNQTCIAGSLDDVALGICKRPLAYGNPGFMVWGTTKSVDGDFTGLPSHGSADAYIARVSENLVLQSIKNFGSSGYDVPKGIVPGPDNTWIVAIESDGSDGDMSGTNPLGSDDIVVFKLDDDLTVLQKKRFGGTLVDHILQMNKIYQFKNKNSGEVLVNDGIVLIGATNSHDFAGCSDSAVNAFVMLLDYSLNVVWQTCIEGSGDDLAHGGVQSAEDPVYYIVGETGSSNHDFTSNFGILDGFLAALDINTGNLLWTQNYGGSGVDKGFDILELPNGNLLTANNTSSTDHDVTDVPYGSADGWLVEFDVFTGIKAVNSDKQSLKVFPNPARDQLSLYPGRQLFKADLLIYDYSGHLCAKSVVVTGNSAEKVLVPVQALSPGLYTVLLRDEKLSQAARFIVSH